MSDRSLAGHASLARELAALGRQANPAPVVTDAGVILPDYSLRILGMIGGDPTTPIAIPMGYWICDERLTIPFDFLGQTPDGEVGGYVTPSDPLTPVVAPREGAHDHLGVGSHSHGDPQGGGTGSSTVDVPGSAGSQTADGGHFHRVITPAQLRPLMPFDFVAVVWLDNGQIPYVTGRIASSLQFQGMASGGGQATFPTPPYTGGGGTPAPQPAPPVSPERGVPPSAPGAEPVPTTGPRNQPVVAVSAPGDTLGTIAQRYGVSPDAMAANNPHYAGLPALPPYVMVVVDPGGS